jgi:hypothetical protein
MQKKLAKLSQDYLGGISDLIRQRPEMGPALLRHARNQLSANMGGDFGGEQPETQQGRQAAPQIPPEAYGGGMMAYGGNEEQGAAYMQGGGSVMPEDVMNRMMLDPETAGLNFQDGGSVEKQRLPPQAPRITPYPAPGGFKSPMHPDWQIYNQDPMEPGWQPGYVTPVMPGGPAPWDDYSLAQLTQSHNLLTNMLAQRAT